MIFAAILVFTTLPFIAFRGEVLRRYLIGELVGYLFAFIVWRQIGTMDPYFAAAAFGVAKLFVFSAVLATAAPSSVRWSANRAALIALLVYALVGPSMLRTPPDGDEPFYLLLTESIVRDWDLDLANQYQSLQTSETRRDDLRPQPGDPVGPNGEQYSRHEPFLSLLLVPGYLIAGLAGAVATIILFAVLLTRSTVRLLEDEGISNDTARAVFPFIAFAPPIVFYAARIWPEVPAALFFVEGLRAIRQQRARRWIPALLGLSLLKLRFLLVVAPLALRAGIRSRRQLGIAAAVLVLPFAVVWLISGSATNVHSWRAMIPYDAGSFGRGLLGLLIDGAAGIAFHAPFYLLGVFAIARWRSMPEGFRLGLTSALLYILFLIPRAEWHGGWAPPLRYIVFLMPVLALGAAAVWQHVDRAILWIIGAWTAAVVVHGIAFPWRLFHIANGESIPGEALSRMFGTDFSRLFPSLIRPNRAAAVGALVVAAIFACILLRRWLAPLLRPLALLTVPAATLLLAVAVNAGRQPSSVVHFEDAHVVHRGGELYPPFYTVARFLYQGGWIARPGDSLTFSAQRGTYHLRYASPSDALITIGGHAYPLRSSGKGYNTTVVEIANTGRTEFRVLEGTINLDRIDGSR